MEWILLRPQHRRSLFLKKALASLKKGEIFGIANGRAEFVPEH